MDRTIHPQHDETKEVINLLGHETTDADAGPVVRFAIFLLVLTLSIAGSVVGFYKYLDSREVREKGQRYPMSEMVRRPLPPPPRLQTYPFTDITALRTEALRCQQIAAAGTPCGTSPAPTPSTVPMTPPSTTAPTSPALPAPRQSVPVPTGSVTTPPAVAAALHVGVVA